MIFEYERRMAVSYARRWALSRNPDFYNYEGIGGDCTNFASQCVYAGSNVMNYTPDFGWYYINANDKSPSWTGVDFFYNFMTNNEDVGPFGEERPLQQIIPGDIIQLGNSDGNFYHTLVLTSVIRTLSGKIYYICAHSEDSYQRNLSTYNYETIRCIHILGVRI
ncbi:MAG: amidase domain-containing protein [Clostridia bacterium]|nr:amidase domain-containing protein [Clostridia bacterium]